MICPSTFQQFITGVRLLPALCRLSHVIAKAFSAWEMRESLGRRLRELDASCRGLRQEKRDVTLQSVALRSSLDSLEDERQRLESQLIEARKLLRDREPQHDADASEKAEHTIGIANGRQDIGECPRTDADRLVDKLEEKHRQAVQQIQKLSADLKMRTAQYVALRSTVDRFKAVFSTMQRRARAAEEAKEELEKLRQKRSSAALQGTQMDLDVQRLQRYLNPKGYSLPPSKPRPSSWRKT
eukprot:scaffold48_cov311-Pinguiococcus_pyrenoidosus.AAC.229